MLYCFTLPSTPAHYDETNVGLADTVVQKRQASLQLNLYIQHPIGAVLLDQNSPLVPPSAVLAIVQMSVPSIQNVTGLQILDAQLLQTSAQKAINPGIIAGPVVGGAVLIVLILSSVLLAWIM